MRRALAEESQNQWVGLPVTVDPSTEDGANGADSSPITAKDAVPTTSADAPADSSADSTEGEQPAGETGSSGEQDAQAESQGATVEGQYEADGLDDIQTDGSGDAEPEEESDAAAEPPVEEEPVVTDAYAAEEGAGTNLLSYENLMESVSWRPVAQYEIPVGCNVRVDCDLRAATIEANPGGGSFTVIGCLDFASGTYSRILEQPVSGEGFAPSEAHLTETLLCWVETNNKTDDWVLYAATFLGMPITPTTVGVVKLDEGDADWFPPQIAVSGSTVVWQHMPDPSGPYVRDSSHAYRWTLGSSDATDVWTSPGRFGCPPSINQGVLTIAPRVRADEGVYYGITAIDLADGTQIDQTVLPVSVRPFRATRIGNDFAFSIEANYGYGGLLGNMGYYFGAGDGPWDYVAREPSALVSYVAGRYVVRSQLAYFVIDPSGWFSQVSAADRCVDYGDYPACDGTVERFVTYAKIKDESTGIPDHVLVRLFTLV